jgi:hypothetical protein
MAHQAPQSFYIGRADGTEEFVPKGKVFPDGHDFVKRDLTGTLFERLDFGQVDQAAQDRPAPKPAPPVKPAPAKSTGAKV